MMYEEQICGGGGGAGEGHWYESGSWGSDCLLNSASFVLVLRAK